VVVVLVFVSVSKSDIDLKFLGNVKERKRWRLVAEKIEENLRVYCLVL
jgi:hypothetical protein